jgi:hypothetical protein
MSGSASGLKNDNVAEARILRAGRERMESLEEASLHRVRFLKETGFRVIEPELGRREEPGRFIDLLNEVNAIDPVPVNGNPVDVCGSVPSMTLRKGRKSSFGAPKGRVRSISIKCRFHRF